MRLTRRAESLSARREIQRHIPYHGIVPFVHDRQAVIAEKRQRWMLRLQVHRRLQAAVRLITRSAFLNFGFLIAPLILVCSVFNYLSRPAPDLLIPLSVWVPALTLLYLPVLWRQNADALAHVDDVAMIGPLLDIAEFALHCNPNRALKIADALNRRSKRHRLNHRAWAERLVLRRLPPLLDRVYGGDLPPLTQQQRKTLRWLIDVPDYYRYFTLPGLSDKIDAVLENN